MSALIGELEDAGMQVLKGEEAYPAIRFRDIGALAYWIHAAGWQPDSFGVEDREETFWRLAQSLEEEGCLLCREHRFFVVAKKI